LPNYIHLREAVTRLPNLNRIIVIGCSGSGKTTLSRKLAKAFDLEYLSLDRDVRWLPGWKERERSEQRAIIEIDGFLMAVVHPRLIFACRVLKLFFG